MPARRSEPLCGVDRTELPLDETLGDGDSIDLVVVFTVRTSLPGTVVFVFEHANRGADRQGPA